MEIIRAASNKDIEVIRALFREYADSLDIDLSFQEFEKELDNLPGEYQSPDGTLLLAMYEGLPAGCVALRKIDRSVCELKRLYVKDNYRKKKIGKILMLEIIKVARNIGYKYMRLDTLSTMEKAIRLYYRIGFKEISPYRYNPIEGALYMELDLDRAQLPF